MTENWREFLDQYQYLIWDFDGTMVDSMWMWAELDRELLLARGISINPAISQRIKTMSLEESAQFFLDEFQLQDSLQAMVLEIMHRAREKYETKIPLKPGVKQLLTDCFARGKQMCIATASDRNNVKAVCEKNGIAAYISFLYTANEVPEGKSGPGIYLKCAERFGAKPEAVLVIEDAIHAAKSAKYAGFPVLGVYDAYSAAEWQQMKAVCDMACERL